MSLSQHLFPDMLEIIADYLGMDLDLMIGVGIPIRDKMLRPYVQQDRYGVEVCEYPKIVSTTHGVNRIVASIVRFGPPDELKSDYESYKYIPFFTRYNVVKQLLPTYTPSMLQSVLQSVLRRETDSFNLNLDIVKLLFNQLPPDAKAWYITYPEIYAPMLPQARAVIMTLLFPFYTPAMVDKLVFLMTSRIDPSSLWLIADYALLHNLAINYDQLIRIAKLRGQHELATEIVHQRALNDRVDQLSIAWKHGDMTKFDRLADELVCLKDNNILARVGSLLPLNAISRLLERPEFQWRKIAQYIDAISLQDEFVPLLYKLFQSRRVNRAMDPNNVIYFIDKIDDAGLSAHNKTDLIELLLSRPTATYRRSSLFD